jgi:hypothetical protein
MSESTKQIPQWLAEKANQYSAQPQSAQSDYTFGKGIGMYNGYIAGYTAALSSAYPNDVVEKLVDVLGQIDHLAALDGTEPPFKLKMKLSRIIDLSREALSSFNILKQSNIDGTQHNK